MSSTANGSPLGARPEPRLIRSWQDAEHNAAAWMRYWGYRDAAAKPGGADGGVDIRAARALGQVKYQASHVGRPELQKLFGARGHASEKQLIFFTGSDYASTAVAYADEHGIALFRYELDGSMVAVNAPARLISAETPGTHATAVSGRQRIGAPQPRTIGSPKTGEPGLWGRHWRLLAGLGFLYLPISHLSQGAIGSRFEFAFSFTVFWAIGALLVRWWWVRRRTGASLSLAIRLFGPSRFGPALAAIFGVAPFVSIGDDLVYRGPWWLDLAKFAGILIGYWIPGVALLAWGRSWREDDAKDRALLLRSKPEWNGRK
ncbi:restriction endonuclease [Planosporangium thailandense]|uniref:restriction endonuclease n=1 Tax=Planosporangium thailandense TaxID=765197 RepID=UPI00197B131F